MIHLQIEKEFRRKAKEEPLRLAALTVLAHQDLHVESEISIVVTNNTVLQHLNLEYREIDAPTDVLSFPSDITDPETDLQILGDVIISFPYAKEQAEKHDHDLTEELQLLVVHGCLHLIGFTHKDEIEKGKMWKAQDEILSTIGVKARP